MQQKFNGNTKHIGPKTINLSNRNLNKNEMSFLLKCFKYTPTPTPIFIELKADIVHFNHHHQLIEMNQLSDINPASPPTKGMTNI